MWGFQINLFAFLSLFFLPLARSFPASEKEKQEKLEAVIIASSLLLCNLETEKEWGAQLPPLIFSRTKRRRKNISGNKSVSHHTFGGSPRGKRRCLAHKIICIENEGPTPGYRLSLLLPRGISPLACDGYCYVRAYEYPHPPTLPFPYSWVRVVISSGVAIAHTGAENCTVVHLWPLIRRRGYDGASRKKGETKPKPPFQNKSRRVQIEGPDVLDFPHSSLVWEGESHLNSIGLLFFACAFGGLCTQRLNQQQQHLVYHHARKRSWARKGLVRTRNEGGKQGGRFSFQTVDGKMKSEHSRQLGHIFLQAIVFP